MKKYKFDAEIQAGRGGGAYVVFPYDTEKEFGTKGKVPVNATIDGIADRGGLFTMGKPFHMLGVPKAIREQIGKGPGDIVSVALWKDEQPREVEVPPVFKALMKKAGVLPFFETLSFTNRKEYCRWITEAKKEETRTRRLEKALEMLKKGVRAPG
jgi:bifunctional DNA-binding transcriptional regulator/antitoxin component of YhaV-PrlF toxin-antitoxin module